jgi:hypothetical protein
MGQAEFQTIFFTRQSIDNAANAEEDVCDSEADDNRHKYHDVLKLIHSDNPLGMQRKVRSNK